MATQELYSPLNRFLRWALVGTGLTAALGGCAEQVEVAPIGVVASALSVCTGSSEDPISQINQIRVVVRHEGDAAPTFDRTFGFGNSQSLLIEDVPEGTSEEVTLLGFSGGDAPAWFGREQNQIIQSGQDNAIRMILAKFGGYSCPQTPNEYTQRLFPTVTPLGNDKFLVAGGLTSVTTGAGVEYVATEGARRAFVYDALTGRLTPVVGTAERNSTMNVARGAHAAVMVGGVDTRRVVFFGGTSSLMFDPTTANNFPWTFDTEDAISTVEVFEYDPSDPVGTGGFLPAVASEQMLAKRVFPTTNLISPDGLVLVCGGGPWGVAGQKPPGYRECDVWDDQATALLPPGKSNNFPNQYRAGGAAVAYRTGEITQLLFVGGVTEGPIAELYRSSTGQRDGAGGTFVFPTNIPGEVPHSFFSSLSQIGPNEFIMAGGVNFTGGSFEAPSDATAWYLQLVENEGGAEVTARQLGGLGVGRYFHGAAVPDGNRLVLLGGFTGTQLTPTDSVVHLQYTRENDVLTPIGFTPPQMQEEPFAARGGLIAALLSDDTILLAGGISEQADLATDQAGALQVYAPSSLLPINR